MSNHYLTTGPRPQPPEEGCAQSQCRPGPCQSEGACGCRPPEPSGSQGGQQLSSECCKESMRSALRMLFRRPLNRYLNYSQTAVLTRGAVLGSYLTQPDETAAGYDNLAPTLSGTLSRVTASNCDFVDVEGPVYLPAPIPADAAAAAAQATELLGNFIDNTDTTGSTQLADLVTALRALQTQVTATSQIAQTLQQQLESGVQVLDEETGKVSLCAVEAVAINVEVGTSETETEQNYQQARQALLWMLGNSPLPPLSLIHI